ncbi:hypothetical protein [Microbacterium marinilacus]|uniref:Uncharacterized protein n=1 Tax=Microbacterium marinilacus TaxID=415209 RepID=A0ABP7BJ00_9MICO|nr:hypothetical protein [Microbacterium marinilacus]
MREVNVHRSAHRGPVHGRQPSTGTAEHLHGRGHLGSHGQPRCGCGEDVLDGVSRFASADSFSATAWTPFRHQHAGYVRAHFIYSDRMLRAVRQPDGPSLPPREPGPSSRLPGGVLAAHATRV